MDRIYSESNEENDHTERIRRQRRSSILKAPRSPLKDLGSGNEFTQDYDPEKRRKNSRRVSFADTIKVFQTDLQINVVEPENTESAANIRNQIRFNQNEGPETVQCEITGMDTLLHAPIQTPVQQTEKPDFDPVKKIDFSEFLTSLKSSEMFTSPTLEGPDKENLFFVPSQLPESSAFPLGECVYSHAQENTGNVTRIFRGQDDGMDITKCHISNINTMFPNTCEALSKQLECGDVTVACGDMDMTASQTVKMSLTKNNTFNIEKHSQTIRMDLSGFVADHSRLKRTSNHQLVVPQDPQRCVEKKTVSVEDEEGITQNHTILIDSHKASQTSNQGCRTRTGVPGCVSFEPVFHGDKTIVFSSCNDMEVTGNCTVVSCNETSKATGKSCYEAFQKPGNAISLLMEKTVSRDDDMDITKCQITSDNQVLRQCKKNAHTLSSVPDNGSEKGIQNHRAASETLGLDSSANPGSWTSKGTFRHSTVTSLLVSRPSDKTVVFSGEDMDLTRSYIAKDVEKGIASQLPPVSADMFTSVKFKPQSFGNKSSSSNLNEQEEMEITKCHAVVIDNQNTGITTSQQQMQPKTIPRENWNKEVNGAVSLLNLDKENPLSGMSDHMDIKRSHPNPKTIIFSSQEQEMEVPKSHSSASNNCVPKPLQRQNCEISQQLRKSLVNPSLAYTNDKTVIFPDDQSMDITRNHTAALDFAPILVAQEYESTHIQNSVISKPKQLQNKTLLFSGGSDIDITRSQTAAIECGSLRMNSNQKNDTPGNKQIPALAVPRFSFTSGDEALPSDIKGNVHFGKTAGIHIDSKNSKLQQQSHTMVALNKVLSNTANPERLSSTSKAASLSSKQDFTKTARTSMPDTKNSQMASLLEKSVVFFSEENMDLTGSCVVSVPDTVLTERKDTLFPKKKELTSCPTIIAADSVQQQGCDQCPLKPSSLSNEKTVIFSVDDDMEMTKSHTMATDNKIYLQGKSSSNGIPLIPADKTVVFTYNDDMEITRPNTVVIDKPMEKAASQTVPELGKGTGRKSLIGSTSEKTVVFSLGDENDMEITKSHTMGTDNKIYLQGKSSSNGIPLIPADKTVVFTYNDDMEITRPNTVVIDKPMEKAAFQTVPELGKGIGRKSLIGSTSEKTVVFSLGDENDMEITKSHTMATDNKIYLQGKSSSNGIPLIPADKTVVFTYNDDMEITRPNTVVIDKPMEKAASQTVPELGKGTGRKSLIGPTSEKTVVFSLGGENDMEITKSHTAPINREIALQDERAPQTQSVVHGDKMVFVFNQDDMEITESHTIDKTMERVMHVDRLKPDKWVGQEAFSNSKTVVFAMGDDMETTKIHTVSLDDKIALQGKQTTHVGPVLPVNETIVFTCNQDKMDITASHTVAINSNNLKGSENQEVSSKSHQQQNVCRTSAPICGEKMHFMHAEDLGNGCHSDFRDKHRPDFPALSVLVFPYKKEETDTLKIHNVATEKSIGPVTLSLPEVTLDNIQEPQNVINLPKGNSSSVYCQDLRKQVKPKSKRVSFKLPENQIESPTYKSESQRKVAENRLLDGDEKNCNGVSQVQIPVQQSHLSKEITDSLNRGALNVLDTGSIDLKDDPGKLTSSRHEHRPTELDIDGPDTVILSYKKTKENEGVSAEWEKLTKDSPKDSEQTKQFSQVNDIPAEQVDPSLVSELSGIVNICSRLKNCRRKSEVVPVSQTAAVSNSAETFPKLATQPEDPLSLGKDVEKEPNNAFYIKEQENIYFETGDAPLDTTHTDKCQVRKLPLGIFPPKLPNKKNSTVPSVEDLNAKSVGGVEAQVPEINLVTSKTSDNIYPIGRQNLSPSQYIDEELLPTCPEEMDSVEFVSYEPLDGTCNEMNKKEIFHNKSYPLEEQETFSNQKRAWEQEEEELQKGKKIKRSESWDGDSTKEQRATSSIILSHTQAETHEGENPPSLSAKSLERTNSSNSSCLDSLKADIDLSMQRSSQMESQLLMDSICEQNLFEKFQDGVITVGEFFTLLQVHILIQKPRQSHLPANYAVNTAPTPEDLIFSQYIYRPKLRIYEEDCQVLSQMIEDLKLCAGVQDKLLVDVNKSLWEVMRTFSDKELKNFGTELNKMKSCFTKKSKVLAHKGKVKLYDNLVQNTQSQWEKLQSRIAKVDEFLREMDSCLLALETVTKLEDCEADISDPVAEWESKVRNSEKELENLKAQEEELQRDLSNLEVQKKQGFSEIKRLQNKASDCEELLDKYNFTEWEISDWSDQHAMFTFLYDSIELTITFGPPVDGAVFNGNPCRKIVDMSFESLLDEEKAPLSSCLVQRLIFQFIESQGSWQTKCPTMHHLPQMLHEVSLVVNRCRLLGEEIEFLNRWGGKFNLLKTEVDNTKVKLLFSTSIAFAKFEVTFSLSANYPSAPLPFTVQKRIGNLGHDEISAVVSNVPLGTNYLTRMVKMIHHNLLQGSLIVH
ncbi:kinetochore scaffold 1 isoform X2 [Malaclemys terrapin pileata]|uniref:kinetochore scaffold 1 isoform X2 n=1 Tax=Malaclemys terrapin pileata TaxID=2991368 RepID=UPI0023A89675|nr:kinetochore scaffold 1 isoform X2 [Malaclemys terrapin pileata]